MGFGRKEKRERRKEKGERFMGAAPRSHCKEP